MTTEPGLKPCPFCNNTALVFPHKNNFYTELYGRDKWFKVICNTSRCCEGGTFGTLEEAIKMWNRRSS